MLILDLLRRYGEFAGIASLGFIGPRRALYGGSGKKGLKPSFLADFTQGSSALIGSGLTFTRASGATQRDFAGVMNPVLPNELRFDGYRRVQNLLLNSQNFSAGSWSVLTMSVATGVSDPLGGTTAATLTSTATNATFGQATTVVTNAVTCASMWIRRRTGTGVVQIATVAATFVPITLTSSWQRFSVSGTNTSTSAYCYIQINTSGDQIDIAFAQVENVTTQTNQNPSEYVSTGVLASPYYGAFVDGVQYFPYQNGNTVTSNVVTAGTGAAIATLKGILREEARTNYFLNSTAPVTQTISLGVGTYTCYIYGSGSMTSSAGTATATGYGAATNSGTDWTGPGNAVNTLTVTVAGTVVFTPAGSVTFAQVEGGGSGTAVALATSPIITAGATAARALDVLRLPVASIPSYGTSGAWQIEMIPRTGSNESSNSAGWLTTDTNTDATLYQTISSNFGATYNGTTGVTTSNAMTLLAVNKLATAYSPGATSVVLNAGAAGNDAVTAQQASVYMNLAPDSTTALHVNNTNAWLRKVRYFPTALTVAQLQTVTGATY